jgi:hypothetical protein
MGQSGLCPAGACRAFFLVVLALWQQSGGLCAKKSITIFSKNPQNLSRDDSV